MLMCWCSQSVAYKSLRIMYLLLKFQLKGIRRVRLGVMALWTPQASWWWLASLGRWNKNIEAVFLLQRSSPSPVSAPRLVMSMNLSLPFIRISLKMIIHVKSHNIVCLPPPHKTGFERVNIVTSFIRKCNRKLLSQTRMCSAMGLSLTPPPTPTI